MSKFSERFKNLRVEKQLSQQNLADQLGFSKSAVNMYERGDREPGLETMEAIADYFNVDMDFLTGRSDIRNRSAWVQAANNLRPITTHRIPLLGRIACGTPIMATEDREVYVEAGADIKADFALQAAGDSMIGARIRDGDLVFIRSQPTVENGEIAAVIINDEATLKRVAWYPEQQLLILKPENPKYADLIYTGEQLSEVRILGKAVAFQSNL